MSLISRKTKPYLVFVSYAILFAVTFYMDKAYPAQMCGPSFGILFFLLLIPVTVILFLFSLYKTIRMDRSNWPSTAVHLVACFILIAGFYWS